MALTTMQDLARRWFWITVLTIVGCMAAYIAITFIGWMGFRD